MPSSTYTEAGIRTGRKLHVFVLCVDDSATAHVNWLHNQLTGLAEDGFDFLLETGKLNAIANNGPFLAMTTQAVAESDVLVIAMGSLQRREPALIQWLNSLAAWQVDRQTPSLLIGLFGGKGNGAGELAWLVNELITYTHRTATDFAWQWMGEESICDCGWLTVSMDELLTRRGVQPTMSAPAGCG